MPIDEPDPSPSSVEVRACGRGDIDLQIAESGDTRDVALGVVFQGENSPCVVESLVVELIDDAGDVTVLDDVSADAAGLGGMKPDVVELTIIDAISTCEETGVHAGKVRLSSATGLLFEIGWAPAISLCAAGFRAGGPAQFEQGFVVEGPLVRSGAFNTGGGPPDGGGAGFEGVELAVSGGCLALNGMPTVFGSDTRWNAESQALHVGGGRVLPVGTLVDGGVFIASFERRGADLPESVRERWESCGLPMEEIWFVASTREIAS